MRDHKIIWVIVDDIIVYTNSHGKMTGIFRYVIELERALIQLVGEDGVRFLGSAYDEVDSGNWGGRYHEISRDEFVARCATLQPAAASSLHAVSQGAALSASPVRQLYRRVMKRLPLRMHRHLRAFGKAQTGAVGMQARAIKEFFLFAFAAFGLPDPRRFSARRLLRNIVHRWRPEPGDAVVIFGAGWFDFSLERKLSRIQKLEGVACAALIYDLIPVNAPHYVGENFSEAFHNYVTILLKYCRYIFTISNFTKQEVEVFARGAHLPGGDGRRIIAVPTGGGLQEQAAGPRPEGLPPPGAYAVFVSSIEPRKNHPFAVEVWRELHDILGDLTPTLYFVGGVAPSMESFVAETKRDALYGRAFEFLGRLPDNTLNHLYEGGAFSFFPSLYEGWGLPVSESLARGVPCFAANTSALPEAGGDLAIYFDTNDAKAVAATIATMYMDKDKMEAWRVRIRNQYVAVSFRDTAASILHAMSWKFGKQD
jgi:glycosyltransferase involved in cell wall biosynthesis